MKNTVIKIENLSKQYRLGLIGTGTLSHDLNRWWHKIRGKEDPYLKIGQTNNQNFQNTQDYVWALKDINLEVKQGEVLGIIGKNGAGKSTLLKILSQVTGPTTGSVKVKGRIGALLEVGTGFHPELTGRENIFLNGAILGMIKSEIKRKLDEIIEFSGTATYIDTPVKRYSSGMRVRLAFAVAAHLDPEILVVDEVLAVGDAEFQKKALGKMQNVSKESGRTILFVSHNMGAIKSLCKKGILLENGTITENSDVESVVKSYSVKIFEKAERKLNVKLLEDSKIDGFEILKINIYGNNGSNNILSGGELNIEIKYKSQIKFISPSFVIKIKDQTGQEIVRLSNMPISGFIIEKLYPLGIIKLKINNSPLIKGLYFLDVGFVRERMEWYFNLENVVKFHVQGADVYNSGFELDRSRGIIWVNHNWIHSISN